MFEFATFPEFDILYKGWTETLNRLGMSARNTSSAVATLTLNIANPAADSYNQKYGKNSIPLYYVSYSFGAITSDVGKKPSQFIPTFMLLVGPVDGLISGLAQNFTSGLSQDFVGTVDFFTYGTGDQKPTITGKFSFWVSDIGLVRDLNDGIAFIRISKGKYTGNIYSSTSKANLGSYSYNIGSVEAQLKTSPNKV